MGYDSKSLTLPRLPLPTRRFVVRKLNVTRWP